MKVSMKPLFRVYPSTLLRRKESARRFLARSIYVVDDSQECRKANFTRVKESCIREKLKELSMPYTDGHTCLRVQGCGVCKKPKKSSDAKDNSIFINKTTGFFVCETCQGGGTWTTFCDMFTRTETESPDKVPVAATSITKIQPNEWKDITENSCSFTELDNATYKSVFEKLKFLPCPKGALEKLQIRYSPKTQQLHIPLFSLGSNIVGYKTIDSDGTVTTSPNIDCPGFVSSRRKHQSAVVVADVADFFALLSKDIPHEILCLPYGNTNLPQSLLPCLERYTKLILWLSGSQAFDAAGNFAKKLNEKRCYIVKPTKNQTSASKAVKMNENVGEILKNAKSAWHESIITFADLRDEVLAELQNNDECSGVMWKRFPVLNKILRGHRRGELTVLTGPTGSGKTTFISEYSLDLAMQGVNTLWGSFEIKNCRLVKRMLQQYSRMPLEENIDAFDYWADKFELLPIYFMAFHGQQPLKSVMDAVEHCSYVNDISHVVIDNVQFMIDVSAESGGIDRFWKQDILIQSFRSFASKFNCHVTLVMHPRKGMDGVDLSVNSIFGGAKAAQEADNIMIIQNKMSNSFTTNKFLQISKNRYAGELGSMPLHFDKASFGFSQEVDEEYLNEADEADSYVPGDGMSQRVNVDLVEGEFHEYSENPVPPTGWNKELSLKDYKQRNSAVGAYD